MNQKHRSRERIFFEILKTSRDPTRISRIVYRCNLNFQIVKGYIDELKSTGMILEKNGNFEATSKGFEYVSKYRDLELLVIERYPGSWRRS